VYNMRSMSVLFFHAAPIALVFSKWSLATRVAHALICETSTLLYAYVPTRACGHAPCAMGYGYQESGA
jgi:hypothetical protein